MQGSLGTPATVAINDASSVVALAAEQERQGFIVQNNAGGTIHVRLGTGDATTADVAILDGGHVTMMGPGVHKGPVSVIGASGVSGNINVVDFK